LWSFGYIFPVLVCCINNNLATLVLCRHLAQPKKVLLRACVAGF
jgi:hypothetical protein